MAGKYSITLQLKLQSPANVAQVISTLQNQLNGISVNLQVKNGKQAAQQVQQLTNATNAAKSAAEKMGDAFGVSLKRFAAFSLASRAIGVFTRYLSNAIDESIAFDRQLNKVKQVTRASQTSLNDLSSEITRLSKNFGVASSEITDTALILAQAGLSATDTKVALEALTKTRLSATFGDINETAEGAVALIAQFGEGAGALERQLGSLNAVSAQFAVESADLIEVIRRTGGVFKASGGNLEELFGLFTSVRATTRESAESIATALKTIFTRIQRPQTIQYLKDLGVELVNTEGAFVGPYEAIRRLSAAFGGLEQGSLKFIEIAEELGGYRQIGKVIPLLQQFATAERARQAALAGGASLTEEAAIAQESLAIQFQKVREEFLSLVRSTTQTDSFKILTKTVLSLATGLIKVAETLKPILPLLTAFAAIKFASNVGGFFGGIGASLQRRNAGGKIHAFARGGMVPGSGNRDTVPAMLMPGEFVIRKSSVKKLGAGRLAAMNDNRYAEGGAVIGDKVGAIGLLEGTGFNTKGGGERGIRKTKITLQDIQSVISSNNQLPNFGRGEGILGNWAAVAGAAQNQYFFNLKQKGSLNPNLPLNIQEGFKNLIKEKLGSESKQITVIGKVFPKTLNNENTTIDNDIEKNVKDVYKDLMAKTGQKLALSLSAGGTKVSQSVNPAFLNKIAESIGVADAIGKVFEGAVATLGAPFDETDTAKLDQDPFDFPRGVGEALGSFFGGIGNIPTDAKRTISSDILDEIGTKKVRNFVATKISASKEFEALKRQGYIALNQKQQPVKKAAFGGVVQKFATGGVVPGTGNRDTVPAMLTPGEFVIRKSSVEKIGAENLAAMNRGGAVQRFSTGTKGRGVKEKKDVRPPQDLPKDYKINVASFDQNELFYDFGPSGGGARIVDTGALYAQYYKKGKTASAKEQLFGTIYARRDPGNDFYQIVYAGATKGGGWGSQLYQSLIEYATKKGSSVASDRKSVSPDAFRFWSRLYKGAGSFKADKKLLSKDDWYMGFSGEDGEAFYEDIFSKKRLPPKSDPLWALNHSYTKTPELITDKNRVKLQESKSFNIKTKKGREAALALEAALTQVPSAGTETRSTRSSRRRRSSLTDMLAQFMISGYAKGGAVQRFSTGTGRRGVTKPDPTDAIFEYVEDSSGLNRAIAGRDKLLSEQKQQAKAISGAMTDPLPPILWSGIGTNRVRYIEKKAKWSEDAWFSKYQKYREKFIDKEKLSYGEASKKAANMVNDEFIKKVTGVSFSFPSFLSTSTSEDIARGFAGTSLLKINTKKDGLGVDVSKYSDKKINKTFGLGNAKYNTRKEQEFILPPKSKFKVLKATPIDSFAPKNMFADFAAQQGINLTNDPGNMLFDLQQLAKGGTIQKFAKGGKAYVFDFDDTLATTEARIGGPNDPDKFAKFRGKLGAQLIESAQASKIAAMAKKRYQRGHDVHVLTARPSDAETIEAISQFMQRVGAPATSVVGVGDMFAGEREPGKRPGTTRLLSTESKKAKVLSQIAPDYDETWFLDDAVENLVAAKKVAGVKTVQADLDAKRSVRRFWFGGKTGWRNAVTSYTRKQLPIVGQKNISEERLGPDTKYYSGEYLKQEDIKSVKRKALTGLPFRIARQVAKTKVNLASAEELGIDPNEPAYARFVKSKNKNAIEARAGAASDIDLSHEYGHAIDAALYESLFNDKPAIGSVSELPGTFQNIVSKLLMTDYRSFMKSFGKTADPYRLMESELFADAVSKLPLDVKKILTGTTDPKTGLQQLNDYFLKKNSPIPGLGRISQQEIAPLLKKYDMSIYDRIKTKRPTGGLDNPLAAETIKQRIKETEQLIEEVKDKADLEKLRSSLQYDKDILQRTESGGYARGGVVNSNIAQKLWFGGEAADKNAELSYRRKFLPILYRSKVNFGPDAEYVSENEVGGYLKQGDIEPLREKEIANLGGSEARYLRRTKINLLGANQMSRRGSPDSSVPYGSFRGGDFNSIELQQYAASANIAKHEVAHAKDGALSRKYVREHLRPRSNKEIEEANKTYEFVTGRQVRFTANPRIQKNERDYYKKQLKEARNTLVSERSGSFQNIISGLLRTDFTAWMKSFGSIPSNYRLELPELFADALSNPAMPLEVEKILTGTTKADLGLQRLSNYFIKNNQPIPGLGRISQDEIIAMLKKQGVTQGPEKPYKPPVSILDQLPQIGVGGIEGIKKRMEAAEALLKTGIKGKDYTTVSGEANRLKTLIEEYSRPRRIPRMFAKGGAAPSDTVPALLTPGEFVINRKSAQRIGYGNLDRMNKQGVAGYAEGGTVGVQKYSLGTYKRGAAKKRFYSKEIQNSPEMIELKKRHAEEFAVIKQQISNIPKNKSIQEVARQIAKLTLNAVINDNSIDEDEVLKLAKMSTYYIKYGFPLIARFFKSLKIGRISQEQAQRLRNNLPRENRSSQSPPPTRRALGGAAPSDTIPALLTPGEFVINRKSAQRIGYGNLDRMNKRGIAGYAKGGTVGGIKPKKFFFGGEGQDRTNKILAASFAVSAAATTIGQFADATTEAGRKFQLLTTGITATIAAFTALIAITSGVSSSLMSRSKTQEEQGKFGLSNFNKGLATTFNIAGYFSGVIVAATTALKTWKQSLIDSAKTQKETAIKNYNFSEARNQLAIELEQQAQSDKISSIGYSIAAGASAGATAGGTLGSFFGFPVLGAISGAIIGGVEGYTQGDLAFNSIANKQKRRDEKNRREAEITGQETQYIQSNILKNFEDPRKRNTFISDPAKVSKSIQDFSAANKKLIEDFEKAGITKEEKQKQSGDARQRTIEFVKQLAMAEASTQELDDAIAKLGNSATATTDELQSIRKAIDAQKIAALQLTKVQLDGIRISSVFNKASSAVDIFTNRLNNNSSVLAEAIQTVESAQQNMFMRQQGLAAVSTLRSSTMSALGPNAERSTTGQALSRQFNALEFVIKFNDTVTKEIEKIEISKLNKEDQKNKIKELYESLIPSDSPLREEIFSIIEDVFGGESTKELNVSEQVTQIQDRLKKFGEAGLNSAKILSANNEKIKNTLDQLRQKRYDAELAYIDSIKTGLEARIEAGKLIQEFGGEKFTPEKEFNIRRQQFNVAARSAGISEATNGSVENLRNISNEIINKINQQQQEVRRTGSLETPEAAGNREKLKRANQQLIDLARQRVEQTKQEIELAQKKNDLEKSAIEKLLGGDVEGFLDEFSAAAAAEVLRSKNFGAIGMFSTETLGRGALSLKDQLEPDEFARILGPVLNRFGLDASFAQPFAVPENIKNLKQRGQNEAQFLADVSESLSKISKIELDTAKVLFTNAQVVFNNISSQYDENKEIDKMLAPGSSKGGIIYANRGTYVEYNPIGTDTVPAMLTPGEYVVNREATRDNLPLLEAINAGGMKTGGKVKYFKDGGEASSGPSRKSFLSPSSKYKSPIPLEDITAEYDLTQQPGFEQFEKQIDSYILSKGFEGSNALAEKKRMLQPYVQQLREFKIKQFGEQKREELRRKETSRIISNQEMARTFVDPRLTTVKLIERLKGSGNNYYKPIGPEELSIDKNTNFTEKMTGLGMTLGNLPANLYYMAQVNDEINRNYAYDPELKQQIIDNMQALNYDEAWQKEFQTQFYANALLMGAFKTLGGLGQLSKAAQSLPIRPRPGTVSGRTNRLTRMNPRAGAVRISDDKFEETADEASNLFKQMNAKSPAATEYIQRTSVATKKVLTDVYGPLAKDGDELIARLGITQKSHPEYYEKLSKLDRNAAARVDLALRSWAGAGNGPQQIQREGIKYGLPRQGASSGTGFWDNSRTTGGGTIAAVDNLGNFRYSGDELGVEEMIKRIAPNDKAKTAFAFFQNEKNSMGLSQFGSLGQSNRLTVTPKPLSVEQAEMFGLRSPALPTEYKEKISKELQKSMISGATKKLDAPPFLPAPAMPSPTSKDVDMLLDYRSFLSKIKYKTDLRTDLKLPSAGRALGMTKRRQTDMRELRAVDEKLSELSIIKEFNEKGIATTSRGVTYRKLTTEQAEARAIRKAEQEAPKNAISTEKNLREFDRQILKEDLNQVALSAEKTGKSFVEPINLKPSNAIDDVYKSKAAPILEKEAAAAAEKKAAAAAEKKAAAAAEKKVAAETTAAAEKKVAAEAAAEKKVADKAAAAAEKKVAAEAAAKKKAADKAAAAAEKEAAEREAAERAPVIRAAERSQGAGGSIYRPYNPPIDDLFSGETSKAVGGIFGGAIAIAGGLGIGKLLKELGYFNPNKAADPTERAPAAQQPPQQPQNPQPPKQKPQQPPKQKPQQPPQQPSQQQPFAQSPEDLRRFSESQIYNERKGTPKYPPQQPSQQQPFARQLLRRIQRRSGVADLRRIKEFWQSQIYNERKGTPKYSLTDLETGSTFSRTPLNGNILDRPAQPYDYRSTPLAKEIDKYFEKYKKPEEREMSGYSLITSPQDIPLTKYQEKMMLGKNAPPGTVPLTPAEKAAEEAVKIPWIQNIRDNVQNQNIRDNVQNQNTRKKEQFSNNFDLDNQGNIVKSQSLINKQIADKTKGDYQTFTSRAGTKIKAKLVRSSGGTFTIIDDTGKKYKLNYKDFFNLTEETQQLIRSQEKDLPNNYSSGGFVKPQYANRGKLVSNSNITRMPVSLSAPKPIQNIGSNNPLAMFKGGSIANGGQNMNSTISNITNNNNNIDMKELQNMFSQVMEGLARIPTEFQHVYNGSVNANINGVGGMSSQMQNIAYDTLIEQLQKLRIGQDGIARTNSSVLNS